LSVASCSAICSGTLRASCRCAVTNDHHGLADAVHYGVSLPRVSRAVQKIPGLHFAPTGSDVVDYAELLAHSRWPKMIAAFAERGELFVVAVRSAHLDWRIWLARATVWCWSTACCRRGSMRSEWVARVQPPPPPAPATATAAASASAAIPGDRSAT